MEKDDRLWGYDSEKPVSGEARRVYSLILPLYHEFIIAELLDVHVEERRRDAARDDIRARLERLLCEARLCVATDVPDAVGTWWIVHRAHRLEEPEPDLRRRRSRTPPPPQLLQDWEREREVLRPLLPRRRRDQPIPHSCLEIIQERYPELNWTTPTDSLQMTPSETATKVLSLRYGVSPSWVKKQLEGGRRARG